MLARLWVVALLVSVACGTERVAAPPGPTAAPTPTPVPTPAPNPDFEIEGAMDHVRALAVDIGIREAGTPGDAEAARYIVSAIGSLGWEASEQTFALPQGGESSNVIGTPRGFDTSRPYVIVGGHRDSLRGPGANDNATGVGAALEVVRALIASPAPLPVKFVAFGAEEVQPVPTRDNHVGSEHYVASMSEEDRRNLAVFVNLDMVGHGDEIICGRISVGPRDGAERCVALAGELDIPARERVTPNWSDHGSFALEGMNTAWLWTGENPCCFHNPRDTIDNVRPPDLERAGRLALAIVRSYTDTL